MELRERPGQDEFGESMFMEIREWTTWLAEWIIVAILLLEYFYDKAKDDAKKQKKTKTTKKITTKPGGESTTEEITETSEPMNQEEQK